MNAAKLSAFRSGASRLVPRAGLRGFRSSSSSSSSCCCSSSSSRSLGAAFAMPFNGKSLNPRAGLRGLSGAHFSFPAAAAAAAAASAAASAAACPAAARFLTSSSSNGSAAAGSSSSSSSPSAAAATADGDAEGRERKTNGEATEQPEEDITDVEQVESARDYAISGFAKALLDVGDSLTNARQQLQQQLEKQQQQQQQQQSVGQLQQFVDGISMTESLFHKTLERFGVQQYDPIGQKFDPSLHEALFEMDGPSDKKGSVAQVVQRGYKIKDRILRAAKVGVVKP
ncbi:co-chaperone GrpE, putative [Eimeria tenella]|uniref:GrpE protein homolog n=1 Tax=Eimeria tenella TaxID=5802 RepID=U6KMN8_EIMTE|nr:co-chaperone GrpE, putative [Eimeria tenella]CDJ39251.1 co-chaperone GrpE, putative [Eimeria tenella]|eukprot:XP_013230006.1 co-chaperone GrpE, putative [Eimeria tenella]